MKEPLEIVLHNEIQPIFDHFSAAFGISIVFYSIEGRIIRRGLDRSAAPFCALIQDHLFSRSICQFNDEQMCRSCTRSRKPVRYRCHAGIEEAVAPLFVTGQLAGYAMIGQFRTSDRINPDVLLVARKKGLEKELQHAFSQLPRFSREQADHLLGLFTLLADYIVTKEMVSVRGDQTVARILAFIQEHLDEPIGIRDAARSCGRSLSTVSHHLKKHTGKTFTQHLNEARIRRAEDYLRQSPQSSIQEISAKVGFNDPFYFSRVFRKQRGFPPKGAKPPAPAAGRL